MVKADQARAGGPRTGNEAAPPPPRRLLLASQSPRRRQILQQHGVHHDAYHPGVDDGTLERGGVPADQWAAALAYLKAVAGAELAVAAASQPVVLGADTVCVKDGEVIGQPTGAADAERIIRLLENGAHEVVTGVALVWGGDDGLRHRRIFVDRARVRVGDIGEARIREYIAGGQWRGKAGAYNLCERQEAGWPISCEGDPCTVMGLPIIALRRVLVSLGHAGAPGAN